MSTRCFIIAEVGENQFQRIYCHHDGYFHGGVGETLFCNYQHITDVQALMVLGNLSVLGIDTESCVAYGRDKHEKDQEAQIGTLEELMPSKHDFDIEWVHVYHLEKGWKSLPIKHGAMQD